MKIWTPALLVLATATACGTTDEVGDDDGEVCEAGHCDSLPFADQLKGRQDPIAKFFQSLLDKKIVDDKGVYHPDLAKDVAPSDDPLFYQKLLTGLTAIQGCDPNALITYALSDDLIGGMPFPRVIATICSNTELVANQFVATLGHADPTSDLALDKLEMFAWDPVLGRYFFYATSPERKDNLKIEVEPARCGACHRTPLDVDPIAMARIPIMNELTKPWTHWNAGDGGVSESFIVPDSLKGKPNWEKYGATASAASRFEKVIRDANANRVTPARSKTLFRPAKIEDAMGIIRPLFCDEQVNYVSELATGEISTDAFVSGGIKGVFRSIQSTWPWAWFNNDIVQLPTTTEDKRLFVMPTRGVAEITFEPQLASLLSATQILAVRSLDWKKPVFSDFRCSMWKDAWTAFQKTPPTLSGRNRDAVKVVYDEILKRAGMSTRDAAAGKFIAMADASETTVKALKDAIASGSVPTACTGGFCLVDPMGFGNEINAFVTGLADPAKRTELLAERDRRVCFVNESVTPVGLHAGDGTGARIANEPSFMRVPSGSTTGVSTLPTCK
jgi:hypothetical protein